MEFLPIVGGGVAAAAALVFLIVYAAKAGANLTRQRAGEIQELGASLGMTLLDPVQEGGSPMKVVRKPHGLDFASLYPGCHLFQIHGGNVYNVLSGSYKGRPARVFEFSYVIHTGKSAHTIVFGVVAVDVGKAVPDVDVRYEGLWHKIKEMFGHSDLHLDNPDFDKKFLVVSGNEGFTRSVFDYGVQERMLETPFDGHMLTGQSAVVYRCATCTEEQFLQMLERANELANQATVALP